MLAKPNSSLTTYEKEVLQGIANGVLMKTMAYNRGCRLSSIIAAAGRARHRLGAVNTPHAVALAFRQGAVQ